MIEAVDLLAVLCIVMCEAALCAMAVICAETSDEGVGAEG